MAVEQTPPEFYRLLAILKSALRALVKRCRRGVVPGDAPIVRRNTRLLREAGKEFERLASQIEEPKQTEEPYRTSRGMAYEPGKEEPPKGPPIKSEARLDRNPTGTFLNGSFD
jgi:hypothetical protein